MYKDPNIQKELETISSCWQTLHATMPYQVPAQYFEELHGIVRASIEKEAVYTELASIAPLLNSIPKTNVYQQPTLVQKKPLYRIAKWAVAAVFIGVILIGTRMYNNKPDTFDYAAYIHVDQSSILQTISDSTLLSYIDAHEQLITTPDISIPDYTLETSASLIEQSSDQELLEYIESSN
jgi:negative regulator of sigma E activity